MMVLKDTCIALQSCFSIETCHDSYKNKWSTLNMTAGHCLVAALIIQDIFGGDIAKTKIGNCTHFFNIIKGHVIDITKKQFGEKNINYENRSFVEKTIVPFCKKFHITLVRTAFDTFSDNPFQER